MPSRITFTPRPLDGFNRRDIPSVKEEPPHDEESSSGDEHAGDIERSPRFRDTTPQIVWIVHSRQSEDIGCQNEGACDVQGKPNGFPRDFHNIPSSKGAPIDFSFLDFDFVYIHLCQLQIPTEFIVHSVPVRVRFNDPNTRFTSPISRALDSTKG